MGLRGRIKRLERDAQGEMITIPLKDGTVERFPQSELAPAFLTAFDRNVGQDDPAGPLHPLCAAARNSSDPAWRDSFYAAGGEALTEPVEDLSE